MHGHPESLRKAAHEGSVQVFRSEVGVQKVQSPVVYKYPSHTPLNRFMTKGLWRWRATCEYAVLRPLGVIMKTSEKLSEECWPFGAVKPQIQALSMPLWSGVLRNDFRQ